MSKLEAEVGAPESVDGNRQLDHLTPAGAVVVVQDEGTILAGVGLAAAQTDAVLQRQGCQVEHVDSVMASPRP